MRVPSVVFVLGLAALALGAVPRSVGEEATKIPPHPRLMATAADFHRVRQMTDTTDFGQRMKRRILQEADRILPAAPVKYQKIGFRLLHVSRLTLKRTLFLSMAFRLTGEKKYADRAIREAKTVCAFQDWNQSHFLDTAEMTLAVAFVYDWLYEQLSEEERTLLAESIRQKALLNAKGELATQGRWWARSKNNWGQVCNGGLLTGAAALREVYPELCEKIRKTAVKNLPFPNGAYQGGGFPEGPSYWEYASLYQAVALSTLQSAWGDDFGLSDLPGWREQTDYLNLTTGPTGYYFNFSDCGTNPKRRDLSVASWFLAKSFNRPDLLAPWELPMLNRVLSDDPGKARGIGVGYFFPMILIWAPESLSGTAKPLPRATLLGKQVQIALLRSGEGPGGSFLATKGGLPAPNHGHLDLGGFVYDTDGARWAYDLGSEGYHKVEKEGVNLWSNKPDSERWTVFRLSSYAHNVVTIDGKQIYPEGFCPVTDVGEKDGVATAQVDLSDVYPQIQKMIRRFELGQDLRVLDTVRGAPAGSTLRWQMITKADAELKGAQVLLSQKTEDGRLKKLKMTIQGVEGEWRFESIREPVRKYDSPNPGFSRLFFEVKVPQDSSISWSVLFQREEVRK